MTGIQIETPGAQGSAPEEPEFEQDAQPGSLLASLRVAAAKQQEEHTEEFVVGGEFRKQLWIRHKPLDSDPMNRFINRRSALRDNPNADIPITELNMDLMAQSCVAVVGADVNGENKEVLEDNLGPVRLEHRLVVLLGLPVPPDGSMLTARDVIMMIFGNNGMAIVNYGDALVDWMQDPASYVRSGESSALSG